MTLTRPHSEPATYEHAEQLAANLSFMDRREIEVYSPHVNPYDSLRTGVEKSRDAHALVAGDTVLAMWGVLEIEAKDGAYGAPWLLSADAKEYSVAAKTRLIKSCKASIKKWHKWYRKLEGFSWAQAKSHHKLLELLGFELSNPVDHNSLGQELVASTVFFVRHLDYIESGERYYV